MSLLSAVVAGDVEQSTLLVDLGMGDDVDRLAFWDAAVEEFAERTLGEPDLTELFGASTAGELITATIRCLREPMEERR